MGLTPACRRGGRFFGAILAIAAAASAGPGSLAAQDSVVTLPTVLRTFALVRVQFAPGELADTTAWYRGTLDSDLTGCVFVTFPNIARRDGHYAEVRPGGAPGTPPPISFAHFRAVETRERPDDPWRVVDPTWVHSRALGCP